jgi:putative hydrolase
MIDLHTHSLFSDGELLVSELVARAYDKGYRALALTDHMDASNIDFVIPRIAGTLNELSRHYPSMKLIPGAEITHVPPEMISSLVMKARELGAQIVIVHGETPVEPVKPGTNSAAIEAGVDILAHPGLISEQEAHRAKEKGVALEITYRKGHCLSNGHVAQLAIACGAQIVVNTDAHGPGDLITEEMAYKVLCGAGIHHHMATDIIKKTEILLQKF